MKHDDIINRLANDNIIDDIQADINAELEKSEPDYDKIAELSALITEITENSLSDDEIAENISKITCDYDSQRKRKISVVYRWISALSACFVLVLALNAYTMVSFGENLLSAVVEMTRSGFSIDFSQNGSGGTPQYPQTTTVCTSGQEVPALTSAKTTEPVPQTVAATMNTVPATTAPAVIAPGGPPDTTLAPIEPSTSAATTATTSIGEYELLGDIISEKCSNISIIPCSLNYYTDMELKDFSYEENELSTDCYFTFMNNESQLDIIIEQYGSTEDIPPVLIPSDKYDNYVISGSIGDVYMFDEVTHITAVFVYENAVYTTIGYNLSVDDMENVVMSYSPEKQN